VGHLRQGYNQTKTRFLNSWLCRYATRSKINTICELGFVAGHSSMLFLETVRSAQVFSFDMYDNPWSLPQGKLMEHTYVQRFKLVVGLSNETVPNWERQHPRKRCDAMFIDGVRPIHPLVPAAPPPSPLLEPARSFVFVHFQQQAPTPCTPFRQAKHLEPRLEDLRNFRRLSSQGAPVFYDEATTLHCVRGSVPEETCPGHFGATQAYNRMAREGALKVVDCPGSQEAPRASGRLVLLPNTPHEKNWEMTDRGQSQSWPIVKKDRKQANRPTQGAREGWEDGSRHAATTQGF